MATQDFKRKLTANQRNVVKAIAGLKELADLEKHIGGYTFEAALETLGRIAQALA